MALVKGFRPCFVTFVAGLPSDVRGQRPAAGKTCPLKRPVKFLAMPRLRTSLTSSLHPSASAYLDSVASEGECLPRPDSMRAPAPWRAFAYVSAFFHSFMRLHAPSNRQTPVPMPTKLSMRWKCTAQIQSRGSTRQLSNVALCGTRSASDAFQGSAWVCWPTSWSAAPIGVRCT